MGMATAGIAFRGIGHVAPPDGIVQGLFGGEFQRRDRRPDRFDSRKPGDVCVQLKGDVCAIFNWRLVEPYFAQDADVRPLWEKLNKPSVMIAFCHFDSGDTHGYVFFEAGSRTRSRFSCAGRLTEAGAERDFETQWLNAKRHVENPDDPPEEHQVILQQDNPRREVPYRQLTAHLLREALERQFGSYVLDENPRTVDTFFYQSSADVPQATPVSGTTQTAQSGSRTAGLWKFLGRR